MRRLPLWAGAACLLAPEPAAAQVDAESSPPDARAESIGCLAQAIAYEAGNEPEAGRAAVAEVVLNRLRHAGFPKSVCGVVYQGATRRTGCQFTFTCDGSLRRTLGTRTWAAAVRLATLAIDGQLPTTVGAATHYHADYVAPRWAPALVQVATIGRHLFYRFPGVGDSRAVPAATTPIPRASPFRVWGLVASVETPEQ